MPKPRNYPSLTMVRAGVYIMQNIEAVEGGGLGELMGENKVAGRNVE
mgnify:CR=1 FL=1